MNWLKKEDSDFWFVNNHLHTTSTGQSIHQNSKHSYLRRIFLYTFCLLPQNIHACGAFSYIRFACYAFFSQKKVAWSAIFSIKGSRPWAICRAVADLIYGRLASGEMISWIHRFFYDLTCKRGSVGQSKGLSLIHRSSAPFRPKPDNSNFHGFQLHRPSIKGTKPAFVAKIWQTMGTPAFCFGGC